MTDHSSRNLTIALILLTAFFIVHGTISSKLKPQPSPQETIVTLTKEPPATIYNPLPDFKIIKNVKDRKSAFFTYLKPIIHAENQRLQKLRKNIPSLGEQALLALAETYEIDKNTDLKQSLLKHIDSIPVSLVLAQAALESAWGTSRFAQKGNNLFGEWCFRKGCGIVPRARNTGAKHEVRRFASIQDSLRSYMLNLNSHPAYKKLRRLRYQQRQAGQALHGCVLAQGLEKYSQKRSAYIRSVKNMIRKNSLEATKLSYCKGQVKL